MILGIGASGRKDMITSKTVKAILEASGLMGLLHKFRALPPIMKILTK
jgi:precorrin-6B methylase 1